MENVGDATQIIDFLLSHIAIPSTCHFAFPNLYLPARFSSEVSCATLDSIRRHVPNKDRVSHLSVWLPNALSSELRDVWLQLVFPEGSLRLVFTASSETRGETLLVAGLLRFLRAYPDTLASATELRIHYSKGPSFSNRNLSLLMDALPVIFPNVKLMSTIVHRAVYPKVRFEYLLPRVPDQSPSGTDVAAIPYPALETLWIMLPSVEDGFGAAQLRAVLSARAELGFPIRCAIVAYTIPQSQAHNRRRDTDLRSRLALEGVVDEVVLMRIPPRETPEEFDWMVWYPEKYGLPADVHRDWPVWEQLC